MGKTAFVRGMEVPSRLFIFRIKKSAYLKYHNKARFIIMDEIKK